MAGQEITGNMQIILIDWLVQVQMIFKLLQKNVYVIVAIIIDWFLQNNKVANRIKYEATFPPEIGVFAFVTHHIILTYKS
ncbi:putative G2-mitotic-specific cyclin-B1-like protein, partial [Naja naja]